MRKRPLCLAFGDVNKYREMMTLVDVCYNASLCKYARQFGVFVVLCNAEDLPARLTYEYNNDEIVIERSRRRPSECSPDGERGRMREGDDGPAQEYTRKSVKIVAVNDLLPKCRELIPGAVMGLVTVLLMPYQCPHDIFTLRKKPKTNQSNLFRLCA